MALKIRLARGGAKRRPFYRVVVAENTSPRDGRFVERVGSYNPLLPQGHAERIVINKDRAAHWLKMGAQPTERVHHFLAQLGLVEALPRSDRPEQAAPKKKAQERAKAAEAASLEAKKAAAAPAPVEAPVVVEAVPVVEETPVVEEAAPVEEAVAEDAPAAE